MVDEGRIIYKRKRETETDWFISKKKEQRLPKSRVQEQNRGLNRFYRNQK